MENPNAYRTPKAIKDTVKRCEAESKKTITLTVNRMLTGSTVEEWDTMLYLKDTASPQEYDQAIFRLQNQYVKIYEDETGDTIKYNMKPQTLLVDFDPNRMFQMQEQKAQIYNVNIDDAGNSKLSERLSEELRISPIIVLNKDKIEQITATDILKAVSEYSRNRGVAEETNDIPVDLSLMDISEIWDVIWQENELGSKAGFETKAAEGEGKDTDVPDPDDYTDVDDRDRDTTGNDDTDTETQDDNDTPKKDPVKQFRMYYARILYFAFLTKDTAISLDSVIDSLNSAENTRIFNNLGLDKNVVVALKKSMDKFMLRTLDYKIQNLNQLSHDETIPALERATVANQKFGKLGESQVVTPAAIADDMVALLPEDFLRQCAENKQPILDLASKEGEFAVALCKRFEAIGIDRDTINDIIYTIPTSYITYEFTRKIYEVLGLNVDNVANKFNAYDLLKVINAETQKIDYAKVSRILTQDKPFNMITMDDEIPDEEADKKVKFNAIVGNPPYQLKGGSGGSNDAPIYQHFVEAAHNMEPKYISLIIPAKWFTTGREHLIGEFRRNMLENQGIKEMVSYSDSHDVFPDVSIKGGICYYLYDSTYSGECTYTLIQDNIKSVTQRKLNEFDILIQDPKLAGIIRKVSAHIKGIEESVASIISGDTPFGIPTNPVSNRRAPIQLYDTSEPSHDTKLFYLNKAVRTVSYIDGSRITKNVQDLSKYKVFMPKAYGAGEGFPHQIIGQPEYAPPNSACSQTYLYATFASENEAINFINYSKTKMFRAFVLASKISQDLPSKTYRFVPMLDFKRNWTDTELYAKYGLTDDEIGFIESKIKPME